MKIKDLYYFFKVDKLAKSVIDKYFFLQLERFMLVTLMNTG